MITLTRRYQISAAHQLTGMREGHKCARLHGHNYEIHLVLRSKGLLDNGMVIDAENIDIDVTPILKRLDHHNLNEVDDGTPACRLLAAQPTVEHLALYLWERLGFMKIGKNFELIRVRVYENDRLWADAEGA